MKWKSPILRNTRLALFVLGKHIGGQLGWVGTECELSNISGNLPYIAGVQPPHQLASPESQRLGSEIADLHCLAAMPPGGATSKLHFERENDERASNFQAQSFERLESMFEGVILSFWTFC